MIIFRWLSISVMVIFSVLCGSLTYSDVLLLSMLSESQLLTIACVLVCVFFSLVRIAFRRFTELLYLLKDWLGGYHYYFGVNAALLE